MKKNSLDKLYTVEELEYILDKLPYEIWIKEKDGKYIYINELGAKNVGLSKKEIIGKTDFEFREEDVAKKCLKTDLEVLNTNSEVFTEEISLVNKKEISYEVHKYILNNNKICGNAKEISVQKNIHYKLDKMSKDLLYELDYNYKTEIKNMLNELVNIFKCKVINLFIYDEENNKLNLYITTSDSNIIENKFIEIPINFNITNISNHEDLINKIVLDNLYTKSLDKQIIKNSRNYFLKVADKLIGLLNICYDKLEKYNYNDEVFIKEICCKLSGVLMNFKYPSNLKKSYKNILKENIELKNCIGLENMKINFLANISHEFKTPINIINSTIQLLFLLINKRELDEPTLKKYLKYIKQNTYRLLRLVNNVMDTTKIDNGFYKLNFKNNNIINIIEEIVLSTAEYIKYNNKEIIFDTDQEDIVLACDIDSIERIMLNLISNALKFTNDNGKIEVNITTDKEKVFVKVKNTGTVIAKENAEKIFKKYVQGTSIYDRTVEGCGIGLYLTKYLVECHKGKIWINTSCKDGAEFIFYIPIKKIKNELNISKIESNSKLEKCSIEFSDIYST